MGKYKNVAKQMVKDYLELEELTVNNSRGIPHTALGEKYRIDGSYAGNIWRGVRMGLLQHNDESRYGQAALHMYHDNAWKDIDNMTYKEVDARYNIQGNAGMTILMGLSAVARATNEGIMMNTDELEKLIEEENKDMELALDGDELELQEEDERKIVWQAKDTSIREFASMLQDGDLDLQPEYQRKYVASKIIASKLIESVLMDVPIPVIYLAEEQDGTYSVIDGQQRLTSFLSYMNGKFPNGDTFKLSGLKVFKELNRKLFKDLDKEHQSKIRKTTLHTIVIKKESNEDVKFEIFERLNTGSIKLNEDEIRNTVYRGAYIKLLAELEENATFHNIVQKDNYKQRMIYRGMILRFFAITERSYINYKPSMKQFCNKELRDNRFLSEEKTKEYKDRFDHCVDLVKVVFGNTAFRRYIPSDDEHGQGGWTTTRINMALYDVQMCGFVNYSKNEVLRNADFIREAMLELMNSNKEFIEAILIQTSSKEVLKKRFKIWLDKLDEIIGSSGYEQRTFSYQVKKDLFDKKPICAISGQQILSIEDSEVDHIIPYSKGGKTELENAQLVLRYFNRAKNNKIEE